MLAVIGPAVCIQQKKILCKIAQLSGGIGRVEYEATIRHRSGNIAHQGAGEKIALSTCYEDGTPMVVFLETSYTGALDLVEVKVLETPFSYAKRSNGRAAIGIKPSVPIQTQQE